MVVANLQLVSETVDISDGLQDDVELCHILLYTESRQ